MYSKQEASQLRQQFWTALGQYLAPVLSAEGEKINWVNYKTGAKDIHFKLSADAKKAEVAIELTQRDAGVQAMYFDQFLQLQTVLHQTLGEEWIWLPHTINEQGNLVSRIYTELDEVSIFKKEDWPKLISFFKPRMIALDEFWNNAKYAFETLR